MFKVTGRKPAQLEGPVAPYELLYLMDRWREVFDGEPLTFSKVKVFDEVLRYGMEAWEFKVLFGIDQRYWNVKEASSGN